MNNHDIVIVVSIAITLAVIITLMLKKSRSSRGKRVKPGGSTGSSGGIDRGTSKDTQIE